MAMEAGTLSRLQPVRIGVPDSIRAAGALAMTCLALHVVTVATAGAGMLAMSLPMLLLSAVCGMCGVRALRTGASAEGTRLLIGGIVMLVVHVLLTLVLDDHAVAAGGGHSLQHHAASHGWPMNLAELTAGLQTSVAALAVGRNWLERHR
jgi:Na+/H+ antiporter NhaC